MDENGDGVRGRFLVKLSGEYLGGAAGTGLSNDRLDAVCEELRYAHAASSGLAVVVGGGNFSEVVASCRQSSGGLRATGLGCWPLR